MGIGDAAVALGPSTDRSAKKRAIAMIHKCAAPHYRMADLVAQMFARVSPVARRPVRSIEYFGNVAMACACHPAIERLKQQGMSFGTRRRREIDLRQHSGGPIGP